MTSEPLKVTLRIPGGHSVPNIPVEDLSTLLDYATEWRSHQGLTQEFWPHRDADLRASALIDQLQGALTRALNQPRKET